MPSPHIPSQDHPAVATLIRELTTTYQALQSCAAHHLRRYGLTPAQADVLDALGTGERLWCGELAKAAMVSRGSLSGILDRLEGRGLIRREPSRKDRRRMLVSLTRSGSEILARFEPDRMDQLARRVDRIDAGKQMNLLDGLRELRQALD